jgi:hydroxyacid-oxoacid transhydrogenase
MSRSGAVQLLRTVRAHAGACPCHGCHGSSILGRDLRNFEPGAAEPVNAGREYAFEMASSNIRFGAGATREVGWDLANLSVRSACVVTDPRMVRLKMLEHLAIKFLAQYKTTSCPQ